MSKRILFLSRKDVRRQYDTSEKFASGLLETSTEIQYSHAYFEDLVFSYDGEKFEVRDIATDRDLSSHDLVFMLGWFKNKRLEDLALSVAIYLNHKGIKFYNTETLYTRSRGKLSQLVQASLNGIKVTNFITAVNNQQVNLYLKRTKLKFPLIVKSASSSRGNDNYLVHSNTELNAKIEQMPDRIVLVQQFVPNDGDYRVLVMASVVRLIIHRKSADSSHLNNTSQGAEANIVEIDSLPSKVLSDCIKISTLLKREVTGVDIIQDKNTLEFYFLEINNMPQLITGSFVEQKIDALSKFFEQQLEDK